MMLMGWLPDDEEGILLPPEGVAIPHPLPYNTVRVILTNCWPISLEAQGGLPLTTLVDRQAQDG